MSDREDVPYVVIERRSSGFGTFFWGAVLGAAVALLYAPRAGAETRRELREGAHRVRRKATDSVRRVQDTVTGTIDDLRGQVTSRVDAAREAYETGRETARETRQEIERRVREARGTWAGGGTAAPRASTVTPPAHSPAQRVEVDGNEQAGM